MDVSYKCFHCIISAPMFLVFFHCSAQCSSSSSWCVTGVASSGEKEDPRNAVCCLAVVVWVSPCHTDHVADPLPCVRHLWMDVHGRRLWWQTHWIARPTDARRDVGCDGSVVATTAASEAQSVVVGASKLRTVGVQTRHPLKGRGE